MKVIRITLKFDNKVWKTLLRFFDEDAIREMTTRGAYQLLLNECLKRQRKR